MAVQNNGVYPDGIADHMNALDNVANPFGGDAFADAAGFVAGGCGYVVGNPATSYEIQAYGKEEDGGPAGDGIILSLTNNAQ
jgi:hypothetical protein